MNRMIITDQMIENGMSKNGGWSDKQIKLLGCIKVKGWRRRLIGKEILTEKYKEFLSLKDAHLKNKKPGKRSTLLTQALDFIYEHFADEDGFHCPFREDCNRNDKCEECKIKLEFDILMGNSQ